MPGGLSGGERLRWGAPGHTHRATPVRHDRPAPRPTQLIRILILRVVVPAWFTLNWKARPSWSLPRLVMMT